MPKTKIRVPQQSGQVLLRIRGIPRMFAVVDGLVELDREEVSRFLREVPGSQIYTKRKPNDPSETD